jgi:octaprenyl-diphosphate synthase
MRAIKYLAPELKDFEKTFQEAVKSKIPLLDIIMKYITSRKGKQMRPLFVLLSAKMNGGINEVSHRAAALIELLHTATLVHDDVVDEAERRRGAFSINAVWKNKIAVLVGDYLLSKGLLLSLNNGDFTMLSILAEAVKEMSEGELLQIEKSRKLDITENVYFEIINAKTASLIASACAAGAYSASQNEESKILFHKIGTAIGIAFQIKDDLFDYGSTNVGKPTGNDIKEKKMTLPLIYVLNKVDANTKSKIKNVIKNDNTNPDKVKWVLDLVKGNGGIEYATEKMNEYVNEAHHLLNQLPDSEAKECMKDLINYTINRNI